jgi:hypothetical protein
MKNVIDQALEAARAAVAQQSQQMVAELNADYDHRNAAQAAFSEAMDKVRRLRSEADELQAQAITALNTALVDSGSISLALINQIQAGEIVSGTPTPARRPKLVAKAAQAAE